MNRHGQAPAYSIARDRWYAVVAVAAITVAACGGSQSGPTAPASTALRADVTDPVGDTVSDSRLPVAPDLVRATATVENGSLTVVVSFAPGTFDRPTSRVAVLLDTDQNPATGIRQGTALGADFTLDLFAPSNQTTIGRADEAGLRCAPVVLPYERLEHSDCAGRWHAGGRPSVGAREHERPDHIRHQLLRARRAPDAGSVRLAPRHQPSRGAHAVMAAPRP